MTDRELLELAAEAAGYNDLCWSDKISDYDSPHYGLPALHKNGFGGECKSWNPLLDDGDALRLAVKLRMEVYHGDDEGEAVYASYLKPGCKVIAYCIEYYNDLPHQGDSLSSTRRAIVRAAAATTGAV